MSSTSGLLPIEVLNEEDALLQEQTGVRSAKVAKQVHPAPSRFQVHPQAAVGLMVQPVERIRFGALLPKLDQIDRCPPAGYACYRT